MSGQPLRRRWRPNLPRMLEEIRQRFCAHPPIDPVRYDFEVGNLLWAFDALDDWKHDRPETLQ